MDNVTLIDKINEPKNKVQKNIEESQQLLEELTISYTDKRQVGKTIPSRISSPYPKH
jgi:hypothetical protein